jgi:hypothetical protein
MKILLRGEGGGLKPPPLTLKSEAFTLEWPRVDPPGCLIDHLEADHLGVSCGVLGPDLERCWKRRTEIDRDPVARVE